MARARSIVALLLASVAARAAAEPIGLAIAGGKVRLADGTIAVRTVHVRGDRIAAVDDRPAGPGEAPFDATGFFVLPAFVDSHVHATLFDPEGLVRGGVGAAIDLGGPISVFDLPSRVRPLRLFPAGQLLTCRGGYPTTSWGKDGYGREISGTTDARKAVDEMADRKAIAIKMALAGSPLLSPPEQSAIVREAHARKLRVGAHALLWETVEAAVARGVDFLVHAPVERLPDDLVKRLARREGSAMIPTLRAFGATPVARDNVRRFHAAGGRILYGTDTPNNVAPGIDAAELGLLVECGLTPAEAIAAATIEPARYFGLPGLGEIAAGAVASVIVVDGNPWEDVAAVGHRKLVVVGGQVIPATGPLR
ncbi:MAG: amidohydrolase family protein [Acidobacteriota bacterium]